MPTQSGYWIAEVQFMRHFQGLMLDQLTIQRKAYDRFTIRQLKSHFYKRQEADIDRPFRWSFASFHFSYLFLYVREDHDPLFLSLLLSLGLLARKFRCGTILFGPSVSIKGTSCVPSPFHQSPIPISFLQLYVP